MNAADLMGGWQGAEDGYLTPQEFRAGLKTIGDADGNGSVEKNEYANTLVPVIVHSGEPTAVTTQTTSPSANAGQSSGANIGVAAGDIIPLESWGIDQIYSTGWSAEALFDTPVYGASSDRIGDVEDLVVGSDGKLISLVAEVGGFWDIGDTHVSVPWDKVTIRKDGTAQIPVTEDTADQYGFFNDQLTQAELSENAVSGLDDQELGPRAWRASELIGDLARIRENNQYRGYGYVSDLIFSEGRVLATIIDRDAGYGLRGPYALPYYGYRYGWTPGNRYYDLPYNREDASRIVPFDYDRL
ncbi:PRC-barrel domain-containing protein (plasmid) [Sinorhizobium meliloti]|uniref:PRC-barrel domain-containing protein n=1 Tax=Rhizobium meliloti TaxID=382 RepID=UPI002D76B030|nr:PRC-barrel domain-containing protein [Sinorhizobium meliloti]WRQ71872.1 PRC-barrel domain-containing protein [Sinorhizobium meliloti]